MQNSFPSFAALTLLSDMFTCQMFCIFRMVTGILTVVTVRSLIYFSNSSETEDPSSKLQKYALAVFKHLIPALESKQCCLFATN